MLGPLVRNCRRTLLTQLMDRLPVLEGVKAHNFQAFGCHILCPVWLLPTRLFWLTPRGTVWLDLFSFSFQVILIHNFLYHFLVSFLWNLRTLSFSLFLFLLVLMSFHLQDSYKIWKENSYSNCFGSQVWRFLNHLLINLLFFNVILLPMIFHLLYFFLIVLLFQTARSLS